MSTPPPTATVTARDVSRRFGPRLAVADLSLQLNRGEVLGLLGVNGAGKTTTLRMLTGTLAPTSGKIEICGIDLAENPRAAKARIGYLPEVPPVYRDMSVDDYLLLAARLRRLPGARAREAAHRARERCGLSGEGARLIGRLSKGYQQRVGIAQAIVHEPDVVVLDEPTAGLDPNQMREVRDLIREIGREHSVILSTHFLPEVESVCQRVQILHYGRVLLNDSVPGLGARRGAPVLRVGLRRPPAIEALAGVPGVAGVEPVSATEFNLGIASGADPAEALAELASRGNWGLYHLALARPPLEEVFAQLTAETPAGEERA